MRSETNFYLSAPHQCSYLDQESTNIFLDPEVEPDNYFYETLIENGFRRSGQHIYRPHCKKCHECIPVRINVNQFVPSKSQKRCINKNNDLSIICQGKNFSEEHYMLYQSYVKNRHKNGGMDNTTKEDYLGFLTSSWSKTEFIEFRMNDNNNTLVAVAVTDVLPKALSAVYTFFATDEKMNKRSLGSFAILSQIEQARRRNMTWLYLGYWIKDNKKMAYKNQYSASEFFINGNWLDKTVLKNS